MTKSRFSLILIAAGALVFYFLFLPQWGKLMEARSDANAAAVAIDQLTMLAAKRDELADTYNSVKASLLDKANAVITTGPGVAALLQDLETIAAKNGMILRSINFSQVQESGKSNQGVQVNVKQGVTVLPITMQVLGTYGSFRRFLSDLELNDRILDITAINFTGAEGPIYEFSMQMKAYYQ